MHRALATTLIGLGFALTPTANAADQLTAVDAARSAARDYLVPLARPDTKPVRLIVNRCRDLGHWYGCRVHVYGATRCNAILRVRVAGVEYLAWMPSARCS